jgi:hypothetical protein
MPPFIFGAAILIGRNLLKFGWELCINLFEDLADSAFIYIATMWGLAYLLAVAVPLKVDAMLDGVTAILGPT